MNRREREEADCKSPRERKEKRVLFVCVLIVMSKGTLRMLARFSVRAASSSDCV
jgi:hypothetical protein